MISTRHQSRLAAAGLAVLLLTSACGGRGSDGAAPTPSAGISGSPTPTTEIAELPKYTYVIDDKATGPAEPVPGARTGGTVRVYNAADYTHLDPQRIYASDEATVSALFSRTLTGWREQGNTISLVGDLANNTGVTEDGGKTWTYTLRDDVTWEDGSKITSQDVKYGLERTFVKDYTEGPTYFQTWTADSTDYQKFYEGPYGGKSLETVTTPDDKTLVIKFKKPHPDLPYALTLMFSAPVKKDKDTRSEYDKKPFSSGPYKIADRKLEKSMTLVRNPEWKPESDPLRTAYPDRFEFTFGEVPLATNQRIIAAAGDDAASLSVSNGLSPEVLDQVLNTPDLLARTVVGFSTGPSYYAINTKRIPDVRVRKALLYAFPRQQLRQLLGGPDNGAFASTISAPSLVGHESYDLYNAPPEGDPKKAKSLLEEAGKVGQTIVYASSSRPRSGQVAVILDQALKEAGFNPVRKILPDQTAQDEVSRPDSEIDLSGGGWLPDWPSGATVYPPLFDGRLIRKGGYNTSHFNDPAINKEMDEISEITDAVEAGRRWAAIDRKLMEQVVVIPNLYPRQRQIYGPKIGGAYFSVLQVGLVLNGLYVKP